MVGVSQLGVTRMLIGRMSGVCESWSLEELVQMGNEDMDRLLTHYESGKIPPFGDIRTRPS